MAPKIQWLEMKPDEIMHLDSNVRELRVIRGIAFITCGRDSQILELGDTMRFPSTSAASTVISPIGSESLVIAMADAYSATEWKSLQRAHQERVARQQDFGFETEAALLG